MHLSAHSCLAAVAMLACWPRAAIADAGSDTPVGLPITRNYTLNEIGALSRQVRLGFDRLGRLAVISGDDCFALNDSTWVDLADDTDGAQPIQRLVTDANGTSYFGTLASWGIAEYTTDGKLRPHNVRPADLPGWVAGTSFTSILVRASGVFFAGLNGVVHWNPATGEQHFFLIPGTTAIFALGNEVYVSSFAHGIQRIDLTRYAVVPVTGGRVAHVTVEHATALDENRALVATMTGRLLVFDGHGVYDWDGPLSGEPTGRVLSLQTLLDGGLAIAIDGQGLFLLSENGEVRLALTSPEYQRINDLATHEGGVLWVATNEIVQKLLYGIPITIVDRRVGVPISWPQVIRWNQQTIIASSGRLYESVPAADGRSTGFVPVASQPETGCWGVAANGGHLLVCNESGVYARNGNTFDQVLSGAEVAKLVMPAPDLCFALGTSEIAALRWRDGRWFECAPRAAGVGFPAVVHATHSAAWMEMGEDRVARVSLHAGTIEVRLFDNFPWSDPRWVNIGMVGDIVVLSGDEAGALFFDERSEQLGDDDDLARILASAPFPIARIEQDAQGRFWATHEKGVLLGQAATPGPEADTDSEVSFVRVLREHQPRIQFTGPDDVWISTAKTLYHVVPGFASYSTPPLSPVLVAVTDQKTGAEIPLAADRSGNPATLPYTRNSLSFRFFSGSYAGIRPPLYEFSVDGNAQEWSPQTTDSELTLHNLKEGRYHVSARVLDPIGRLTEPVDVSFAIAPPWSRSPLAYASYALLALSSGGVLFFWALRRTRRRNAFLENLVRERTDELRATMDKLNEETRNTATLAERNRLAGEIHDSLQQGLSGLMLQLDATLKLPELVPDVRTRLTVARKMVSFTRHEVQQAVWNLESPLLENADLVDAIGKMAAVISAGKPRIEIRSRGTAASISSTTQHELLRIAQEAMTNAVRHGNAQKIFVHLEQAEKSISLQIFDDGCGFVPAEIFADGLGHFGLRGLRGRASKINGELQIISAPNRGTTVRIVVPLIPTPIPDHATVVSG